MIGDEAKEPLRCSVTEDSAGAIMTTEYVRLKRDMTVLEAFEHIRRVALEKETVYTCYVTDEAKHLIGTVTAKKLFVSELDDRIEAIMDDSVAFVYTTEDKENVSAKFSKYGYLALPVVDFEQKLVGIITVDDAIEVIEAEREEDFAKMAAITPVDGGYMEISPFSIWKSRIPWLLLLMISATLTSTILSRFESALPSVLLIFIPMLMDTGGNSGAQSSVSVIRGISTGEIVQSALPRVALKELVVGAACGVTLGFVAFFKVLVVDRLIMSNPTVTVGVALSVSVTLFATVITAKLIGALLPLLAKRIGLDPAVMASPIITTTVDALSLTLYFIISAALI